LRFNPAFAGPDLTSREGSMTTNKDNQPSTRQFYLREHGVPILLSSVLSSVVTVLAVLGVQHYLSKSGKAAERQRLEEILFGKWELIESTQEPVTHEGEREWIEFRKDATLRSRSFSTITANGKLVSKSEQFRTIGYKVVDGEHIVWNADRDDYNRQDIKVAHTDDELTLHKPGGVVERYKRMN
jgi:hypothetical protein